MTTIAPEEFQALLSKFRTLPEQDRYDLWADLWEGVHRRTFAQVKPPDPPAPSPQAAQPTSTIPAPTAPTGAGVMETLSHDDVRRFVSAKDLGGTGDFLEECPLPSRRLTGVEYVIGSPRMEPLVRSLKQALYDTLIVPEDGHVGRVQLFDDCRWFPNHTPKTEKDTNMTCNGQLGYPLEYDLRWIDLKFEKFAHPDDLRRVLKGLTFKWIRGQNTPWLRVTLSGFEPYLAKDELLGPGASEEQIRRLLAAYDGMNKWTRFRASVLALDGGPQRIGSTESFRVEVSDGECGGLGELHGPVRLKVLLGNTLFAPL